MHINTATLLQEECPG